MERGSVIVAGGACWSYGPRARRPFGRLRAGSRDSWQDAGARVALPDAAHIRCGLHHRLAWFAGECFGEVGHVYDDAVDAVARGGVRVGQGADAHVFGTFVGAVPLREADEEALLRGEAVDRLKVFVFVGIFPRHVGQNFAAQIGNVFAERELAVDVNIFDGDIS